MLELQEVINSLKKAIRISNESNCTLTAFNAMLDALEYLEEEKKEYAKDC